MLTMLSLELDQYSRSSKLFVIAISIPGREICLLQLAVTMSRKASYAKELHSLLQGAALQ